MADMSELERQVRAGEVVAVLPPFYENTVEGGFEPMPDEMVLAQPCVKAAFVRWLFRHADAIEILETGLRNVGVDPTCGACMAVFYTGMGAGNHTCPGPHPGVVVSEG